MSLRVEQRSRGAEEQIVYSSLIPLELKNSDHKQRKRRRENTAVEYEAIVHTIIECSRRESRVWVSERCCGRYSDWPIIVHDIK
jgi:hypothetical protein